MGIWDDTVDSAMDGAEWVDEQAQSGALGSQAFLISNVHEAGQAVPEESRDEVREAVAEDPETSTTEELIVTSATWGADAGDAAEDGAEAVRDPSGTLFPWWVPYAAGGVGLVLLLVALRPYASLLDGVA